MNEDQAIFCVAFPCNPRPFLRSLKERVESHGRIDDDYGKRIAWVLVGIVRGQLFKIDLEENARFHHAHLARLPGRSTPFGVLQAMEKEADGCDTSTTIHQWWSSIASVIYHVWGSTGTLDDFEEYNRLRDSYVAPRSSLGLTAA